MERFGLRKSIIEDIVNIIKEYNEVTKAVILLLGQDEMIKKYLI